MKPLPNYNFESLTSYSMSLRAIEEQIRYLIVLVEECDDDFTSEDREQLVKNIQWLKRFYETAERNLLDGNK
jgi:hypothetical protein